MKHFIFLFTSNVFVIFCLNAQNRVGINTTSPEGILEVHDPSRSELLISSDAYFADTTSLIFRNMVDGTTGTEFQIQSRNEEGLLFSSRSDVGINSSPEILSLLPNGKVGIGTASPEVAMDIRGWLSVGDEPFETPRVGTIRFNSVNQDFEGYTGSHWVSLTGGIYDRPVTRSGNSTNGFGEYTFGWDVALEDTIAVVGDPGRDYFGSNSGLVQVYKPMMGNGWGKFDDVFPSDAEFDDFFGTSVDIDGNVIVVGAPGCDVGGQPSGAAYVFTCSNGVCTEDAILTPTDPSVAREFGFSIAISGNYILVGAPTTSGQIGAAYLFRKSGGTWSQLAKLNPSNGGTMPRFGHAVDIEGSRALIGSPGDEQGTGSGAGYVFTKSGSGQFELWLQEEKLLRSGGAGFEEMGKSVALTLDEAFVGVPSLHQFQHGGVVTFSRAGTNWTEEQLLEMPGEALNSGFFGHSLDVSGDVLLIGAIHHNGYDVQTGAAYVFKKQSGSWWFSEKLVDPQGQNQDKYGAKVALRGINYIVSAPISNSGQVHFGRVR